MDDASSRDFQMIRRQLAGARGQEYWRSLEELANSRFLEQILHQDYPRQAAAFMDTLDRRGFSK